MGILGGGDDEEGCVTGDIGDDLESRRNVTKKKNVEIMILNIVVEISLNSSVSDCETC